MSANSLHIGIAGSAFNPLCDIFHMLIVSWGKLTAARRTSWCSRSTQRIQSLYDQLRAEFDRLRSDMAGMEQRIKDQLTIRLGLMMSGAIAVIAALVKLL